jgi:hypothetical protein
VPLLPVDMDDVDIEDPTLPEVDTEDPTLPEVDMEDPTLPDVDMEDAKLVVDGVPAVPEGGLLTGLLPKAVFLMQILSVEIIGVLKCLEILPISLL